MKPPMPFREARAYLHTAQSTLAAATDLRDMPDRLQQQLKEAYDTLLAQAVIDRLRRVPITEIRRFGPNGLRTKPLEQAGVTNLGQVIGWDEADFTRVPGVGPKTAPGLVRASQRAVEATAESTAVSIDRSAESMRLLSTAHSLRRWANEDAVDKDIAAVEAIAGYLPVAAPAQSRWKWLLSGAKRQAAASDALVAISQIMATPGTNRVVTLLQDLSGEVNTVEMARTYLRAPDDYHAIILIAVPHANIAGEVVTPGREERQAARKGPAHQGSEGPGQRHIGPYQISRKLGAGAFGTTYAATNERGDPVAVKVLKPEHAGDPRLRASIGQEVTAAARINSRYFARVLRHDLEARPPWIAQQFVPGRSLERLIKEEAPLPVDRVRWLGEQICLALQDLERFGVVHHDLKPANLQVQEGDALTVLDLGVSWTPGQGPTTGTMIYLPPEAFDSGYAPDPSTDMWSAGVILAEASTGMHPVVAAATSYPDYSIDPHAAVMRAATSGDLDLSAVPRDLRRHVRLMTDLDARARPSAGEVVVWLAPSDNDLHQGLQDEWIDGLELLLRMSTTRGIGLTIDLDDGLYVQWAPSGDHLQVEVASNEYLPPHRHLSPHQQQWMRQFEFAEPSRRAPNWWLQVGEATGDFGYRRAATVLVRALLEVYRVPPKVFAHEIGNDLRQVRKAPDQWLRDQRGRSRAEAGTDGPHKDADATFDDFGVLEVGDEVVQRRDGESAHSFQRRVMDAARRQGLLE